MAFNIIFITLAIAVDQLTKLWARRVLSIEGPRALIKGFMSLIYVENRGMAFGMMQGGRVVFIIFTVIVVTLLVIALAKGMFPGALPRLSICFIISGALGNFIDRLFLGYVTDMFRFDFVNFPIFNVADICLTIGTALLIIYVLKGGIPDTPGVKTEITDKTENPNEDTSKDTGNEQL